MTGKGPLAPTAAPADAERRRPSHRPGLITRASLVGHLAAIPDDVPLVVLTAPAGYGKTTTLDQWSDEDSREFAWVALEEADSDPVRLAGRVALALHGMEPVDPAVFRALAVGDGSRHAVALSHLLTSLRSWTGRGVLVLDDAHRLRNAAAMNFIRALAARLPPGLHIAIGSRLALSLGRLRSEGRCAEFGPDDLAFSEMEVRELLTGVDPDCSDDMVRAVYRRTEGWPAGVYLTALAIRASSDAAGVASRITGDDPYIVDYFREELLARESPETVRFLMRTAPLDEMCPSLCDYVLGPSGSAVRLADAARRSLFVVPLARSGTWYRYHRLLAAMLLSELRRREPGEELRVHSRASAWYAEQGQPEKAVAHAIAGHDMVAAAQLMNRHSPEFVSAGRQRTVRGWLEALGDDGLTDFPPLGVTAAWMWALGGDADRAQRCLHAAERGSFDGQLPDGSSSLTSAVTLVRAAMGALGVERMLLDATRAATLEPPGSPWHPAAVAVLGIAHALAGSPEQAVKELDRAARLGREAQRLVALTALGELSLLAAERHDWPGAERDADGALELVEAAQQEQPFSILAHVAAARVAAHRGDGDRARRCVAAALQLQATSSTAGFPWLSAQTAIVLGEIFLDLGDFAAARFRAEEARGHLNRLLSEGVLREQLRVLTAGLARQGGHALVPSAMTLTSAEMRVLQLLPTHFTLGEIGDELHTSRNTVKTQVAAVYRKLQCSTRSEAVRRGHDLGLLGS